MVDKVEKEKIRFKDLSFWLKVAVVGSFAFMAYWIIAFIVGFVIGIMEAGVS